LTPQAAGQRARASQLRAVLQQPGERGGGLRLVWARFPEDPFPAGYRVSACVDLNAQRAARQPLYVTLASGGHGGKITPDGLLRPRTGPRPPVVRKGELTWSPVTESNRRPSPYHVPPSGSGSPGTGHDQAIRWHTLAETSRNQRRRAPFCPSKCPSGSSPGSPRQSLADPPAYSSTAIKLRVEVRERRVQTKRWHLVAPPPNGQPERSHPISISIPPVDSARGRAWWMHACVPARCRSPEQFDGDAGRVADVLAVPEG